MIPRMKNNVLSGGRLRAAAVLLILLGGLLVGCSAVLGSSSANNGLATPAPTATLDSAGYRAVDTKACPVSDWTTMQTSKPQGDLIAWQPGRHDIAFVSPSDRSSWYVGDLTLAKAPNYQEMIQLAPAVLSAGDLTWSPSGSQLAFLAFRPNDNAYTVMVVRPDGSGLTDLFPADLARTDSRTSQKAIIGWKDEQTLQVMTSCGEECRNAYDVRVSGTPGQSLTPTPITNYQQLNDALSSHKNVPTYQPEQYPKVMGTPRAAAPQFSPSSKWVAYLDKKLLLWVLSPKDKITFPVDIGLRDVSELQWSSDDQRLAVRAEDRIFVFQIPCNSAGK